MAKFCRITLVRLTLALFFVLGRENKAQEIRRAIPVNPVTTTPTAPVAPALPTPVPGAASTAPGVIAAVNDTANFLAGFPVSADSPLAGLAQDPAWRRHASFFDQAWAKLDANRLAGIRKWEANYLPVAGRAIPTVFYMFSGPDLLYAQQFFPNARTYILAGRSRWSVARRVALCWSRARPGPSKSREIPQQRFEFFVLHHQRDED